MSTLVPKLLEIARRKYRHGDEAERLRCLGDRHTQQMDETLEDAGRKGMLPEILFLHMLSK